MCTCMYKYCTKYVPLLYFTVGRATMGQSGSRELVAYCLKALQYYYPMLLVFSFRMRFMMCSRVWLAVYYN